MNSRLTEIYCFWILCIVYHISMCIKVIGWWIQNLFTFKLNFTFGVNYCFPAERIQLIKCLLKWKTTTTLFITKSTVNIDAIETVFNNTLKTKVATSLLNNLVYNVQIYFWVFGWKYCSCNNFLIVWYTNTH